MVTPEEARRIADAVDKAFLKVPAKALRDLADQVEALQADAERYRWLRNESVKHKDYAPTATLQDGKGIKVFYEMHGDRFKPTYFLGGADLDSVIDAARKDQP